MKLTVFQKKLFFWLFLGLLVRFLLMPFFAHGDIIAVHRRVEQIACQGRSLLDFGALGVHGLELVFTKISSFFVPCSMLSGIQESFYNAPFLNRMLFFFKLPYLLFELGYWALIWLIFKKEAEEKKRRIAFFLAFNPVILYSVYIFGRFETYPIFFSTLILFLLNKMKKVKFGPVLLISLMMAFILDIRQSYLFILPALAIVFGGLSLWGILTLVFSGGIFLASGMLPKLLASGSKFFPIAGSLESGMHTNYIFQGAIDISQGRLIYFFLLLVGIILIWWLEKRKILAKLNRMELFSLFAVLIFLSYYATSIFHPQYLSWVMPFFLVLMVKDEKGFLWRSFWWSLPFYFLFVLSWGNATTFGTLFPVSLAFKQIEPGWFFPIYPMIKWANIGLSVFAAFCLYWIFYLLRKYGQDN